MQLGFRRKVRTRDQIFYLRIIVEKAYEFSVPLYRYSAFIDDKKAFISVRHSMLWTVLKKMNASAEIGKLLRNLYSGQQAAVRMEGEVSTWFTIVHQERSNAGLSPLIDLLQLLLRKDLSRVGG